MGNVLSRKRALGAIVETIETTLTRARERDDFVKARVDERLGPYEPLLTEAAAVAAAAVRAHDEALAAVLYTVEKAQLVFGEVQDEVRNALGRPRSDATMALLFPEGMAAVRRVAPRHAALTMGLVAEQMRKIRNPKLDEARLAEWSARLEAAKGTVVAAAAAEESAGASASHARASYARLVHTAWLTLPALKRVLKADGLTEAQVHSVIPDAAGPRHDARGNGHDTSATVPAVGSASSATSSG